MKKKTMMMFKMSAVCCAAILGLSATNLPVHAMAPVQSQAVHTKALVMKPAAAGVKVHEKVLTTASKYLNTEIKVPQLSGMLDKKYQEELNYIILSHAEKDLKQWEKDAAQAAAEAKANHQKLNPYDLYISYSLKSDGTGTPAGIVSLEVITAGSTGGTGMPRIDTYNVKNKAAAERVTLADLLGKNYKEKLDADILAQIKKNPDKYFVEDYKGTSTEQTFYIEHGELVIVFPKYSIAPGSEGSPEFRFSLKGQSADSAKPEAPKTGKDVKFDLKKAGKFQNRHGITMVSLRDVAHQLNFELTWNKAAKSVELHKNAVWTRIAIGKDTYAIAKMAPKALGAAPVIHNNKIYVPVQFVSEILNAQVQK